MDVPHILFLNLSAVLVAYNHHFQNQTIFPSVFVEVFFSLVRLTSVQFLTLKLRMLIPPSSVNSRPIKHLPLPLNVFCNQKKLKDETERGAVTQPNSQHSANGSGW